MSHKWVLESCQQLLSSFDKRRHTPDTHFEEAIARLKAPDDSSLSLLRLTYDSCFTYEKGVKVLLDNFYADKAGSVLRSDYQLFRVLACVAVFALEDVGFAAFGGFVSSQDATKMYHIVSYVFDEHNLQNHLKADLMAVYDLQFIEDTLIPRIQSFAQEAHRLCSSLEKKALGATQASSSGESTAKSQKAATTRPVSPNITKPRPPRVPEPFAIYQTVSSNPVPESLYNTSLAEIEEQKQKRFEEVRSQTLKKYEDATEFQLHETRNTTDALRREAEERLAEELQFSMSFHQPPPDFASKPANVRLNTAAILREEALLRQQQARDAELIRAYEVQLRDAREYYTWQHEMTKQDEIQRLQQVELRRELAKASAVEAKLARATFLQENIETAKKIREESNEVLQLKVALEQEELRQKQELRHTVASQRAVAPARAKESVLKEREEAARRVREELAQQQAEKRKKDEEEAEERADAIRKLKASLIHQPHVNVLDPTETANLGLLEEMSLLELRERLARQKILEEEAKEQKRHEILAAKQKKAEELQKRVENITRAREERRKASRTLRERDKIAKQESEKRAAEAREVSAKTLLTQIEAKHASIQEEREALRLEQERVRKQQIYLGAAKSALEERQFDQLLKAAEREARKAAQAQVAEVNSQTLVAKKERINVRTVKVAAAEAAAQLDETRRKEAAARAKETKAFTRSELAKRKQRFRTIRDSETKALESFKQLNPYATMISKRSVEEARTLRSVS